VRPLGTRDQLPALITAISIALGKAADVPTLTDDVRHLVTDALDGCVVEVAEDSESLVLRSTDKGASLAIEDAALLEGILNIAAEADRSARRCAAARDECAATKDLFRITNGILGHLDVESSLKAVMSSACEALRAEGATIWVRDLQKNTLRVSHVYNFPDDLVGTEWHLEAMHPHSEHLLAGRPWIEDDVTEWLTATPGLWACVPQSFDAATAELISMRITVVGAPLWSEGEVTGALMVNCAVERRSFGRRDAEPLVLFANAASVVLNNARLYSETVRLSSELEGRVRERTAELVSAHRTLQKTAKQLRLAADATNRIQDEERGRIAADLHDRSCQLVAAALFDLQASDDALAVGNVDFAREKIAIAKQLLKGIDAENRKVIEGLVPSVLLRHGLVEALGREIDGHRERHGGRWDLQVIGEPRSLEKAQELAVYRIVQEALNNGARHSAATSVLTCIRYTPEEFSVDVEDDGVGFDRAAVPRDGQGHMGLMNLQTRAESVGGHVEVHSRAGHGTRISFRLESRSRS
jgi:signal transduction histidine kinase